MNYNGPSCFRKLVEESYAAFQPFMTRKDTPEVLFGIDALESGKTLSVKNSICYTIIDEACGIIDAAGPDYDAVRALDDTIRACAVIDSPNEHPGFYNNFFDTIVLSTSCFAYEHFRRNHPYSARKTGSSKDFSFLLGMLMVQWEMGDCVINRDLQNQAQMFYRASHDPQMDDASKSNAVCESLRLIKEWNINGFVTFEYIISGLASLSVFQPEMTINISGPKNFVEAVHREKAKGPREFIAHSKQVMDTSYTKKISFLELM